MPSLRAFSPKELEEALVRALETYGVAKETTLSNINGKTPSLTPAGNVPIAVSEDAVGVAKETTLSSAEGWLESIDGKTPALTAAGNRPIAISEDVIGLLKEATFTGRLDRIVRPDTPETGKDQLITGIEGDVVGLAKEGTLSGLVTTAKPKSIASVFDTSVSAETDVLATDITIESDGIIRVVCAFDTSGVLRAKLTRAGVTKILDYNAGGTLVANALYAFDLPVKKGDLFNLRYSVAAVAHYIEVQFILLAI